MELQEQQAKAIVHEINQVLPQKINLMNQKGIIIASTDPDRVHTFHGGAPKLLIKVWMNCAYIATMNILALAQVPILYFKLPMNRLVF